MKEEPSYLVEIQEDDSTPWDDGHAFTKRGAWARTRALAALVVPDWPHPIFVRVYLVRKDEKRLIWSEDLRNIQPTLHETFREIAC